MPTIWVTGARGFIGQHLSKHLAVNGNTVMGLGHGTWPEDEARAAGVSHWINGDVNAANLQQLLQVGDSPERIYHLAGGSSVGLSMQFPQEDFQRTVVTTAALLEWLRLHAPKSKLVTISSAAVYGNCNLDNLVEQGNYTPFSPYGFHKRMAENLCENYAANFGLNTTVVRLFSIFGPGLQKQLLWDVCNRLKSFPQSLELHGTGEEIRDWLHVDAAVQILDDVGRSNAPGFQVVNGGTGQGTSVREIVAMLTAAWNSSAKITFTGRTRAGDPQSLVADTTALHGLVGAPAERQLRTDIADYVQWFKGWQK